MGKDQVNSTSKVRIAAVKIVYDVNENGAYTNLALDKYLRNSLLIANDRSLLTEIVNGTIRMMKHLDWVLNHFLRTKINRQNKWLRNILRVSLYQILFMDGVPDYAAVNEGVTMTRKMVGKELAGVVNGVLRNIIRNKEKIEFPPKDNLVKYFSVYYSHPEWIVEYLLNLYGPEETMQILTYNNQPPDVQIRTNILAGTREELVEKLEAENVICKTSHVNPWGIRIKSPKPVGELHAYNEGRFYVQNSASMLAAPLLHPEEGSIVYDLCSGVGGKTTHLAEYMHNKGRILALDLYSQKAELLKSNCLRLGITMVESFSQDVLEIDQNMPLAQSVLLDAPCSGLGVLNRRSDSRWRKLPDEITILQQLQEKLIHKAGDLVGEGGLLLYSTCTVAKGENEDIVKNFMANSSFQLENIVQYIPFFPFDQEDRKTAESGMLTIKPGKYGTDGMFYALMRRKYS
ncbi:MAG: 16S rRNA (cytosine(967)-C(5))-methyltransferase RsmB [Syntrophomonadaceae bacterium]|nr:16S rRNA (cytosine(967)-C(5))-methyltransferase RsmB [Syntrophomonadaceae bacterium]MDD4548844.1 16S rRNA (cytosine(967)-C(5))-methyltransferase RsmB [Syntrophomonadaceae bacterium]